MPNVPAHGTILGDDEKRRCWWCGDDPIYVRYHDQEWGRPVRDDQRLFEKICLEGFQSGLSWITILKKRPAFRESFADFDFHEVSRFGESEVQEMLQNAGIVRHQGKIRSVINNAARAIEMVRDEGSLDAFFWSYQPTRKRAALKSARRIPTKTAESTAMSKELKRRGWSFVGPTTCYAFMQSMGIVNDHMHRCDWHAEMASLG
ncbi:MAG: DNA-3-methyladenine glycosylase I [Planctomycetota bacterium]